MIIGLLLGLSFFGDLWSSSSLRFLARARTALSTPMTFSTSWLRDPPILFLNLPADLKEVEKDQLVVSVKMENADQAAKAAKIFTGSTPDTTSQGAELSVKGNLSKLLGWCSAGLQFDVFQQGIGNQ